MKKKKDTKFIDLANQNINLANMYTVHFAKTNLSKLLQQAEDGKHVVLARGKKPIARLVPCKQLPNQERPHVGTITSKPLLIVEKSKPKGSVGEKVLYF